MNSAIEDILGVNRSQFSQIAMIAQGEFRKLITASTDDRKKILEKLFLTSRFTEFQQKISRDAVETEQNLKNCKLRIKQDITENDFLKDIVGLSDNGIIFASVDEFIVLLGNEIQEEKTTLEKLNEENREVAAKIGKLTEKKRIVELYNENQIKLAQKKKEYDEKENELKELEIRRKKAEMHIIDIEVLVKKSEKIANELPDYGERDNLTVKLSTTRENKENAKTELQTVTDKMSALLKKKEENKTELEKLRDIAADKLKTENELQIVAKRKNGTDKLKNLILQAAAAETAIINAQDDYIRKRDIADVLTEKYNTLNKAYLDAQAGVLAQRLEDGCPCPVCGSVTHPKKACLAESVPTEDELKKAKKASDDALNDEKKASVEAGNLKGVFDEKQAQKNETARELFGEDVDIDNLEMLIFDELSENNRQTTELEEKLVIFNNLEKMKAELEDENKQSEMKEKSLTLQKEKFVDKITRYIKDIEFCEERISVLNAKLCYASREDAETQKRKIENEKNGFEKEINESRGKYDFCSNNVAEIKGAIATLEKALENKPDGNIEELNGDIAKQIERQDELDGEKGIIKTLGTSLEINSKTYKKLIKEQECYNALSARFAWLDELNKTANGRLNNKIQFDTYVQMCYFERIIKRANVRFSELTDGQYELVRREEASDRRSQTGLDLDIIDHCNSTRRSVNSLSGGEAFKASLALALGLSDEIQCSSGGVQLDALFVDEGFGSLDETSLEQAMRTLASLAEDGNRIIGIISHVNELKDRIDKKIIVTKDATGKSRAVVEV